MTSTRPIPAMAVLALGVLGMSLLLFRGRLETSDELLMGLTAEALATRASLTFAETHGQTSTGYGLGMPLLGVPLVWLGGKVDGAASLLPLVNAGALALLAVLAAGVARALAGPHKGTTVWTGVLVLASPLLPASVTFYSDLVAAAGLMAVVAAMVDRGAGGRSTALAGAGALLAMLARPSVAPLVLVAVGWGWRQGRSPARLLAPLGAMAVAAAVALGQNWVLRGSPWTSGYVGQEFTTPLLTGLHGLLLSPERGLLVFFPALLVAVARRDDRVDDPARDYGLMVVVMVLVALGVHAPFWTWHGGWTAGPRFLLPVVAVAVPLVAARLARLRWGGDAWALAAVAMVAWGAWGAILHSMFSAHRWWNEVWNFHQVESRWLFEPSLSLWQNAGYLMTMGRWEPVALRPEAAWRGVPVVGALVLAAALALGGWRPLVQGMGGAARLVGGLPRASALVMASAVVLVGVAGLLRGPRGWESGDDGRRVGYLVGGIDGPARWAGLLDLPTYGSYTLQARLAGEWTLAVDGAPILAQPATEPRRLQSAALVVADRRPRLVEIAAGAGPAQIGLYWSWPGEGRLLQPAGGEYVLPRDLSPLERAATMVWRRWVLVLAGALALAMLLASGKGDRQPDTDA